MDKRFRGKIAVVTGAGGRNIGRALAVGFAREGARTVLVGRTESSLADVAAEIKALWDRIPLWVVHLLDGATLSAIAPFFVLQFSDRWDNLLTGT